MKKIKLLLCIVFLLIFIFNINVFANASINKQTFDFVYWQISEQTYLNEFLKDLGTNENWYGYKCTLVQNSKTSYIIKQPIKYEGNVVVEYGNYYVEYINTFFTLTNLDALSNANISKRLKDNGVYERIEKIDFIDPIQEMQNFLFPYTILVTMQNNEKYFFVLEKQDFYSLDKIDCNDMEFLTKEQYLEKYSKKSGCLYVNGKLTSNRVRFYGKNISIPIRDILEGVGYKVGYYKNLNYGDDYNGYNITFSNKTGSYTLDLYGYNPTITNNSDNSKVQCGWRSYFSNEDNMYFAPHKTVSMMSAFFGKTLKIDIDNKCVYLDDSDT